MRVGTLAGALAIGWGVASCGRPAPHPEMDARAAAADAGSVSLERGPCFGTCPVYRVTLDRGGRVRFEGRRFVADTGISFGDVPAARVDSLFAELEAAGYFDLADSYSAGDQACQRYATDLPTVTTELRLGHRRKRIEHDRGCADAPPILAALETRIDEVAGVQRWISR